jgi:thiol-disulfide isomerase/thioredoxin
MSKTILFILSIIGCTINCTAQSIKGKLEQDENWKSVVYLMEVSNYQVLFTGSSDNVVDSFYLSTEGLFYFNNLKQNTLYRLNVIPKSSEVSGAIFQNGEMDNYAFFVTDKSKAAIYMTGDIARLTRSYKLICVDSGLYKRQEEVLAIRELKLPNYDLMVELGKQMQQVSTSDTVALGQFQHKAINQMQAINKETNISLLKYLQGISNPQVLALGLIYYDFEQNYSDTGISTLIQRLKPYSKQPLIASILDRVHEFSGKIDISFLSKEYNLINGKPIKMDTINSRFILLDFWASWCLPCRKSIKGELKNVASNFKNKGLQIVGVNIDEDKAKALQAIKKDNNTNLQIWEGNSSRYLYDLFKVKAIPYYVLIDKQTNSVEIIKNAELIQSRVEEIYRVDQ